MTAIGIRSGGSRPWTTDKQNATSHERQIIQHPPEEADSLRGPTFPVPRRCVVPFRTSDAQLKAALRAVLGTSGMSQIQPRGTISVSDYIAAIPINLPPPHPPPADGEAHSLLTLPPRGNACTSGPSRRGTGRYGTGPWQHKDRPRRRGPGRRRRGHRASLMRRGLAAGRRFRR